MSPQLVYAVGTLAIWLGIAFSLRAVYLLMLLTFRQEGLDGKAVQLSLGTALAAAAIGFLLAGTLPMDLGHTRPVGTSFPLVWFVLPFWGWLMAAAIGFAVANGLQLLQALNDVERRSRLNNEILVLLIAGVSYWLFRKSGGSVEVLRGSVPLKPLTAAAILAFSSAAVVFMVWTARAAKARGVAKAVVTQLALLTGSVVFGLPFMWMLITSFKEDRDMSSPNGIVWVPRVKETVPYFDPKEPQFRGVYEGKTVVGTVMDRLPNGRERIDIVEPANLRGLTYESDPKQLVKVPKQIDVVSGAFRGQSIKGKVVEDMPDGKKRVSIMEPAVLRGTEYIADAAAVEQVRHLGLRWQNYTDALEYLPLEANDGLTYLKNTLIIVIMSVLGTILSSSIVAYAFSRMRFPGKNALFIVLLSTLMLPGAVTVLPKFLIFRQLGWIDTLYPLWAPAFLGSAFYIFLLRQFFLGIPMELEDAAKIDGCSYLKTFWAVMLPQIKPALAVIAIWTFMAAWNDFMGPLIYISSPEHMPISYALQLFKGDRANEPGLIMAFATLSITPVIALFFFAQKYFIEGVTLSGFGGR